VIDEKGTMLWKATVMTVLISVAALIGSAAAGEEGSSHAAGQRLENRARVCMLQDSVQPKDGLPYQYDGKTYYLCCGGCRAAFAAQADRYSKATDPVTGQTVDKAEARVYAYKGRAYFFASEENLSAFEKDPERYLRKLRDAHS
jgi:YHS domain-containing protein